MMMNKLNKSICLLSLIIGLHQMTSCNTTSGTNDAKQSQTATDAANAPVQVEETLLPPENAIAKEAQQPLVMVWNTDQANMDITLAVQKLPHALVDYDVDCNNDGTYEITGASEATTCHFEQAGSHRISVRGYIPTMRICSDSDLRMNTVKSSIQACLPPSYLSEELIYSKGASATKQRSQAWLTEISQWGDIPWLSTRGLLNGCDQVHITATDAPDLTRVSDASHMFAYASNINEPLNHWDVSHIENMSGMFYGALHFNQPLDAWNVANAKDMSDMFMFAEAFNQPLSTWNVAQVTSMSRMFHSAYSFNQPLDAWNITNVKDAGQMFRMALQFNQPLNAWNVSNITNMENMFQAAIRFDQPLEGWQISANAKVSGMLSDACSYNKTLSDAMEAQRSSIISSECSDEEKKYHKIPHRNGYSMREVHAYCAAPVLNVEGMTMETRFLTPVGYVRANQDSGYAQFLRELPLLPDGSPILYYDGSLKPYQEGHVGVLDVDVGKRDLQQCADAAMRLRTEYLYKTKQHDKMIYHLSNGQELAWSKWKQGYRLKKEPNSNVTSYNKTSGFEDSYANYRKWLDVLMMYAGVNSVMKESKRLTLDELQPGDVFANSIGAIGHLIIIIDVAENDDVNYKNKRFLLAQSYMPAQQIQILKNPYSETGDPWYSLQDVADAYLSGTSFITPEWDFPAPGPNLFRMN